LQAAQLLILPRLAFAVALATAMVLEDPINFPTDGSTSDPDIVGYFNALWARPSVLAWGAVALLCLVQFFALFAKPKSTPRSRLPFAEISAANSQWNLGMSLLLVSLVTYIFEWVRETKPPQSIFGWFHDTKKSPTTV